jgi:hypothetical protein
MPWIFYGWGITLSHEGASLAADCLIDALSRFDSVQVAGVGMTGLPLVSSIVSRGLGRYTGLYVRGERENWGLRRQVEGVADKELPVVVVDDCVCSGNSLMSYPLPSGCTATHQYNCTGATFKLFCNPLFDRGITAALYGLPIIVRTRLITRNNTHATHLSCSPIVGIVVKAVKNISCHFSTLLTDPSLIETTGVRQISELV